MRTRTFTLWAVLGIALSVGLGVLLLPIASFAQRPAEASLVQPTNETVQPGSQKSSPTDLQALLSDDAEQAAEEVVKRTSKDASDAVAALNKEAESLRARLQKVEAAIGRLDGVLQALEAQQPQPTPFGSVPMPVPMEKTYRSDK